MREKIPTSYTKVVDYGRASDQKDGNLAALATAQLQPRYTVIDLGTLGGTYSSGFGINNAGDVAGQAAAPAQTDGFSATAFLWSKQKGIVSP